LNFCFRSLKELSESLKNEETTPTELTDFFLKRLREHGPTLNAVVNITKERALRSAKKADREIREGRVKSVLHGIPYGVKDLLATKGGIPTTWGAAPLRNQVFDFDATVIQLLDASGGILCAKLAMIELAGGMGYKQPNASFTGPCATPWSLEHWSGGSSSGSGAAVSSGIIPYAIGSETWGSILSPATNCGVTGLRPTYGRVSRHGAMALSWTLDKLGPLTLNAEDCGLVLEAISGQDPMDESTTSREFKYNFQRRDFKFAFIKDSLEGCDEEVAVNFNDSLQVLEKFSSIEEITVPDMPYESITRTILNAEAASAFDEFAKRGLAAELTAPEDRYGPYGRSSILAVDYLKAMRLRKVMCKNIWDVMKPYDAVIGPSRTKLAPQIGEEFRKVAPGSTRDILGSVGNGAGLPSITVPNGFSKDNLPTGIQFMGKPYSENIIISSAVNYQKYTSWHLKHPDRFLT
jgi:aspartyl-tRNA(Asn)/glutamyl-tRNA(Gln) amidotransferase subunit A